MPRPTVPTHLSVRADRLAAERAQRAAAEQHAARTTPTPGRRIPLSPIGGRPRPANAHVERQMPASRANGARRASSAAKATPKAQAPAAKPALRIVVPLSIQRRGRQVQHERAQREIAAERAQSAKRATRASAAPTVHVGERLITDPAAARALGRY